MASVVGIFPNHDAVSNLAHALKAKGFDLSLLTVISVDGAIGYLRSTCATFIRRAPRPQEVAASAEATPLRGIAETRFEVPGDEREEPPQDYYSSPELEALSELRAGR